MGPSHDIDDQDRAGRGGEDPLVPAIIAAVDRAVAERPPAERTRVLTDIADAGRTLLARPAQRTGSARGTGPTDAAVARIVSTLALVANIDDERGSGGVLIGQVLTQVDERAETDHRRA